jgi:hypothetical protein
MLSAYKKRMLRGFLLSLTAVGLGAAIITYSPYPVFGIPFLLGGGFASFFYFIYMVGEYEEDDADARTISQIANGYVEGLEVKKGRKS